MNVLIFLIPVSFLLGLGFVIAYIVAARSGQFDDLETPAHRLLLDEQDLKERINHGVQHDH